MEKKVDEIRISFEFLNHPPGEEKVLRKMEEIRNNDMRQVKDIVLNEKDVLIDGYATLLAMYRLGLKDVSVSYYDRSQKSKYTQYCYCVHEHEDGFISKPYLWRVSNRLIDEGVRAEVGDVVLARTRFGMSPVKVVEQIWSDKCPEEVTGRIKTIVKILNEENE